jgi:hypothetical protein
MTKEEEARLRNCLLDLIERTARNATTAAEVEALAAVVHELIELVRY